MAGASGRGDSCEPAAGVSVQCSVFSVQKIAVPLLNTEHSKLNTEKATPTSVPLLKFAPSLGLAGVAVPSSAGRSLSPGRLSTVHRSYRHAQGQRENISIEINPAGEVRRGTGLIASASGRFTVGSMRPHADGTFQPAVIGLLLPTSFSGSEL